MERETDRDRRRGVAVCRRRRSRWKPGRATWQAWDSLAQINVVSEIEAEFGVSIPIEQVAEIRHIRDFLGYLEKTP